MNVMGRSLFVALVGIAMVAATIVAPLTHLHVATGEHHHADGGAHRHNGRVHAHLAAHENSSESSTASPTAHLGPPGHDDVVSLDMMLTEPAVKIILIAGVRSDVPLPAPTDVSGGHMLDEPRAHGPPIGLSVLGRAPPA